MVRRLSFSEQCHECVRLEQDLSLRKACALKQRHIFLQGEGNQDIFYRIALLCDFERRVSLFPFELPMKGCQSVLSFGQMVRYFLA